MRSYPKKLDGKSSLLDKSDVELKKADEIIVAVRFKMTLRTLLESVKMVRQRLSLAIEVAYKITSEKIRALRWHSLHQAQAERRRKDTSDGIFTELRVICVRDST